MKQVYELHGAGRSIRSISRTLGISRNAVRKYLRAPAVPMAKARPRRPSKLTAFHPYLRERIAAGVDNCALLLRELRQRGYTGGVTILKDFVHPLRHPSFPHATQRFETAPGDQAQVDWGHFTYLTPEGAERHVFAFVLVLSWSRAIYVECVPRADEAAFLRCHVNAFTHLGGVPRRCLYDNAKVVVTGRESDGAPRWNTQLLDFSLRLGFELRLCRPYRAQTKGRVESGVKYVRRNFWPSARFTGLRDLNQQALTWCVDVADQRVHGTTKERPAERLVIERPCLGRLPEADRLAPFLREKRKVGRDGFVQWEGAWYGVPWQWAGKQAEVWVREGRVELWNGSERLAVHPPARRAGERLSVPGQWAGLPQGAARPRPEGRAVCVGEVEVERRDLAIYEAVAEGAR